MFLLLYGWRVLDPFYVDWLVVYNGDTAQHYVGWELFRSGGWRFPFGLTNNILYPYDTSVVFTDSLPLLALSFKLLLGHSTTPFQYFGWWGILCFFLQGGISALILRKYTNDLYACVGSVFFSLAPVMIWRMYAHTALAGQWLILLMMYIIVYYDETYHDLKKAVPRLALIAAVAVSTHMYLTAMCGILACVYGLIQLLHTKNPLRAMIPIFAYILCAAVIFFLLGGFSAIKLSEAGDGGFGYYSFNLNGFWNPQSWSKFLPNQPYCRAGQYEGFGYLGLGVLLGVCAAAVLSVVAFFRREKPAEAPPLKQAIPTKAPSRRKKRKGKTGQKSPPVQREKPKREIRHPWEISVAVGVGVTLLVAVSNAVTFDKQLLFEYPLPELVTDFMSIFRCTGRFIWIVVYFLMFWAFCTLYQKTGPRIGIVILAALLAVQIVDISPELSRRHKRFFPQHEQKQTLRSDLWQDIPELGYRHIAYVPDVPIESLMYEVSLYAAKNRMTVNSFYLARSSYEQRQFALQTPLEEVRDDILYLFVDDSDPSIYERYPFYYNVVDDLVIGTAQPIPNGQNVYGSELNP